MRKIKYEEYDEAYVKAVLPNLRHDLNRIALTEHFLEKIEHRNIHEVHVTDDLECIKPTSIHKIPGSRYIFELEFPDRLIVIICLFPPRGVILITAYEKTVRGR